MQEDEHGGPAQPHRRRGCVLRPAHASGCAPVFSHQTLLSLVALPPGEFKQEPSGKPYDQWEVGKTFILSAGTLDPKDVRKLAKAAMIKRLQRECDFVPSSAGLGR